MSGSGARRAEDGSGRKAAEDGRRKPGGTLKELIPPDGGYGWVIVFATGLTNFCIIPLIQNFGLLYKDSLKKWNITTAEYSVMMNLQFAICNGVGLIAGPLLKNYGYQRVAVSGAVMISASAVLTSQVNKLYLFLLAYSILGGAGIGFVWISTSLAINTYFKARRGVATGIAWAATGLSPVIFPHLLTWVRTYYDLHGTVLITAGLMMHSIPATMLLHPVERHAEFREVEGDEKAEEAEESKGLVESAESGAEAAEGFGESEASWSRRTSLLQHRKRHSLPRTTAGGGDILVDTQETLGLEIATPISLHSSRLSLDTTAGTTLRRTAGHRDFSEVLEEAKQTLDLEARRQADSPKETGGGRRRRLNHCFGSCLKRTVEYFDLDLLCDTQFLMIFIGMTLAYGGEINFSLLAPFVFLDYDFSLEQVATLMSTLASVDLVTRFTMPFFSDHFKFDSLLMYAIGLFLLGTGRIMLAHLSGFSTIISITLWLGFGKGLRTVYMTLVLPAIVSLEKLPSASGLQTLANGIFFFTIGPLFGYIRDSSDNYTAVLYAIDFFTFGAILVWLLAAVYTRNRNRKDAGGKAAEKIKLNA
ncbi:monocarboxylate transporter 9-like [Hetaerina americana]|uniref:monocarboxylate transporter 9-like n=1 Tax=Hetaerina americana TaxID=62018 RepID=UPI003A7F275D